MKLSTSFEQSCKKLGIDPVKAIPDVSAYPEQHQKALIAMAKLFIINEDLNRDKSGKPWKPDWNNYNEYKYYAWFDLETYEGASSPGFRFDGADFVDTNSLVGSRLCYRTRALAEHAAKHFIDLYRDIMIL